MDDIITKINAQNKSYKETMHKAQDYCYNAIENLRKGLNKFMSENVPYVLGSAGFDFISLLDGADIEVDDVHYYRLRVFAKHDGTPLLSFVHYNEEDDTATEMFNVTPNLGGWATTLTYTCTLNIGGTNKTYALSNLPWELLDTADRLEVVSRAILKLNKFVEIIKERFGFLSITYDLALNKEMSELTKETDTLNDICDSLENIVTNTVEHGDD